jgi:hypothetical protein
VACSGEGGAASVPETETDASGQPNAPADASAPDARAPSSAPVDWTVNGHALTTRERDAMNVIALDVVPRLKGTRDDRLTFAARGAWWALKEGTWDQPLAAVYAYSNCNTSMGDKLIGPLESCGTGRAWQVGIAAVQVPGRTTAELEALGASLFAGTTPSELLAQIAADSNQTKAITDGIVASTGTLRASWLLRVPAIGFATVIDEVVPECIDGSKTWCFGSGWEETKKFAPTKAAALVSIADLRRILGVLTP